MHIFQRQWLVLLIPALGAGPVSAEETLLFATPRLNQESKVHIKLDGPRAVPQTKINPRRGTVVVRLAVKGPFGGYGQHVTIYPGPPFITLRCSAEQPKPKDGKAAPKDLLNAKVEVQLDANPDGSAVATFEAAAALKPDDDLYVAWAWSGIKHRLFVNGKPATTYLAASPLPREIQPALLLLQSLTAQDQAAGPIHEIAVYDYAFTEAEAARDFAEKDDQPFQATSAHGPTATAEWAPGERKAHVTIDIGNEWLGKAKSAAIRLSRDGKQLSQEPLVIAGDGFAESVLPLAEMSEGKYRADVLLRDQEGKELAKATTDEWDLPKTPWLGNKLGATSKVQPPWTPIEHKDGTLQVWGRDYELAGGFGLPRQIVSQGRKLLARPVELEVARAGQSISLADPSVQVTNHEPHAATWTGSANADDLRVHIDGRLDYDGMMLVKLRLEPSVPGRPVRLDGLKLHTVIPRERALFLNTATDQGFWWYSYKSWLPDEDGQSLAAPLKPPMRPPDAPPGKPIVLHDNTKQRPGKTTFLFFVLLHDHDVGLEWFADNLAGWQVDERKTLQEISRDANGDVRLTCHLVNLPCEITQPVTITFGYDATPVKPLPPDWRSAYVYHHAVSGMPSNLHLWWLWDGAWSKHRSSIFSLLPENLPGYAEASGRVPGVKLAPFTNQHVLIASGMDRTRPDKGWPWLKNLLGSETDNDGWIAVPTSGARDYWAWNIDKWVKYGGMDAIYIDEAGTSTTSARLLTGSGYVRPDGTHGVGHNTLAMREQLKRVRQVFIDNRRRPLVWAPVYGMIIPHAYAFVDIVSEGESFQFPKPGRPDWVDSWSKGLLERRGGPGVMGGPWLLSLGPAQKFGFVPIFLNYNRFPADPQFVPAMRGQYGVLGLLDIIPSETIGGWFFRAKHDFGVAAPETTFHRFFEQRAVATERADVPVSYYRRGDNLLMIVTNLGAEAYTGAVKLDRQALGLDKGELTAKAIDGQRPGQDYTAPNVKALPFAADGATINVRIPPHDFAMIKIEGSPRTKQSSSATPPPGASPPGSQIP